MSNYSWNLSVDALILAETELNLMEYMTEPQHQVPILHDVDVAVAGGGAAGVAAAVAAARQGARTVLIEKFGSVGGCMSTGGWAAGAIDLAPLDPCKFPIGPDEDKNSAPSSHWVSTLTKEPVAAALREHVRGCGLAGEWMARLLDMIEALGPSPNFACQSNRAGYLCNQMLEEAGVVQMLQTTAAEPIIDGDNVVHGLYVETVSGRHAVKARVTIDATANAALAHRAGAPLVPCNREPSLNISVGIGNVDDRRFADFVASRLEVPETFNQWIEEVLIADVDYVAGRLGAHINRIRPVADLVRQAWEEDGYQAIGWIGNVGRIALVFPWQTKAPRNGMWWERADIDGDVDTLDAAHMTLLERDTRKYVFDTVLFLRKYFPGFENAYLMYLSPYIGMRGGRAIEAEYIVTHQDLIDGRRHDDVIHQTYDLRTAKNFTDIPYRQLLPKRVEGLLVAGVAAHQKPPNLRGRENVLTMGQAAGIAAALCARQDVHPRDVDVKQVQRALCDSGVVLGSAERVEQLLD